MNEMSRCDSFSFGILLEQKILIFKIFVMLLISATSFNTDKNVMNQQSAIGKADFLCNPLFCSRITCPEVSECPFGEIVQHASVCGCCEKCVRYLDENEACEEMKTSPYADHPDKCKVGLECKNGFCKKGSETSCEAVVKRRLSLRNEKVPDNVFSKKLWIPECDIAGRYKAKQCKEKKCLCVDEDGHSIFGQEERELSENMTCDCSRAMHQLEKANGELWMIRTQEHCTHTGDYDYLQCIGELCFCSNRTTGDVIGRVTKRPFLHLLPCYNKEDFGHRYERQCELQLMRTRSLRYQFFRKNIDIVGLEHVRCDVDGTFAAKQCQPDRCACTDREGTGIKSYYVEKDNTEREMKMKCNCARDEHDREATHARYSRMTCDSTGNFIYPQCFGLNDCYCVDEDGDAITEKLGNSMLRTINCSYLLELLHGTRTSTTTTTASTITDDYSDDYDYR